MRLRAAVGVETETDGSDDSPVEVLSSSSLVFSDNSRPAADSKVSEGFEIVIESSLDISQLGVEAIWSQQQQRLISSFSDVFIKTAQ